MSSYATLFRHPDAHTVANDVPRALMRGRRSQGRRRESIAKIAPRAELPALGSHAMLISLIKHGVYPSEPNNPLTHGGRVCTRANACECAYLCIFSRHTNTIADDTRDRALCARAFNSSRIRVLFARTGTYLHTGLRDASQNTQGGANGLAARLRETLFARDFCQLIMLITITTGQRELNGHR